MASNLTDWDSILEGCGGLEPNYVKRTTGGRVRESNKIKAMSEEMKVFMFRLDRVHLTEDFIYPESAT